MKKSFITILCVLTAFSLCLGGCGNDGSARNISGTADTNISTDSKSVPESGASAVTAQPDGDRTAQSTSNAASSFSSQNSGTHPVAGFYYMETPYYVNHPQLIPIPQVLLDYEDWINSKEYRDSHMPPFAGQMYIPDFDYDEYCSKYKQFRIMSCALLTQEQSDKLTARYHDRYEDDFYDRQAYLVLIDEWYADNHEDSRGAWNGSKHAVFFTGFDKNGKHVIYNVSSVGIEDRSSYTDESGSTLLRYPTESIEFFNKLGLNLRNTNHMTH